MQVNIWWSVADDKSQDLTMADHGLAEVEEQVDLDGDNDIEEMMDDEAEDPVEDDDYRKEGDEYAELPHGSEGEENGSEGEDRGFAAEVRGSEGESQENVLPSEVDNDVSSASKNEEETTGSKGEDERLKYAELLALPPHGSEVFIGGIPRNATEEDLRELCEPFGEIFEVRMTSTFFVLHSRSLYLGGCDIFNLQTGEVDEGQGQKGKQGLCFHNVYFKGCCSESC